MFEVEYGFTAMKCLFLKRDLVIHHYYGIHKPSPLRTHNYNN